MYKTIIERAGSFVKLYETKGSEVLQNAHKEIIFQELHELLDKL